MSSLGANPGQGQQPPTFPNQASPLQNLIIDAGAAVINTGISKCKDIIDGPKSQYVQSYISRLFADRQYYFQVNDDYVKNKLKMVLFPFLHRGPWTRISEPIAGELCYKPPIYDINAPDLYIPIMAFFSYIVLAGLVMGFNGVFNPGRIHRVFFMGIVGWFLEICMLKGSLYYLSNGEAAVLEIVAYAGYAFTGISLAIFGRLFGRYLNYVLLPWTCICMSIFLVKTMKRVLYQANTRTRTRTSSHDPDSHHRVLLFIALAQFPLFLGLVYWEVTSKLFPPYAFRLSDIFFARFLKKAI